MRSAKRLDYFRYMDSWVVPAALACLLVGAFLIAAPAIFHIESSLKDILIAAGGLVAGQITILIGEIPRARERSLEKRQLTMSAFLVGVSIGWLSLVADLPEGTDEPEFLGKTSAHLRRLGISEKAFDKVSESHVSRSESLKAARDLCGFYEGSVGTSHPLLLPVYKGGLTSIAAGNVLCQLESCAKGSKEEVECLEAKHKAIQNLKQSTSAISKSREYGRPGEEILKSILGRLQDRDASYEELIRHIESLSREP